MHVTGAPSLPPDILHDNTEVSNTEDAARWKAFHEDFARIKEHRIKGDEANAVGQRGLDLASGQINTVAVERFQPGTVGDSGSECALRESEITGTAQKRDKANL